MSKQVINNVASYIQEDTTLAKYRLAKHGTNDREVVAAVDASAFIIGSTNESADSTAGNSVGIPIPGSLAKVSMSASASKGASITATTGGQGVATTTDNDFCVGYLMEECTAADQVCTVMILPRIYNTV
jgi:hypothetical protein